MNFPKVMHIFALLCTFFVDNSKVFHNIMHILPVFFKYRRKNITKMLHY